MFAPLPEKAVDAATIDVAIGVSSEQVTDNKSIMVVSKLQEFMTCAVTSSSELAVWPWTALGVISDVSTTARQAGEYRATLK